MSISLLSPPVLPEPHIPYGQLVEQAVDALPSTMPTVGDQLFFALDIDGTIAQGQGVSQRMRSSIKRAQEAGANVVIATGRGIPSAWGVALESGVAPGWGVCSNGALTIRWDANEDGDHSIEAKHVFDARPLANALQEAIPGVLLGSDNDSAGMQVSELFPEGELLFQEAALSLDDLLARHTTKLVARAPWMDREEFVDALGTLDLSEVECAIGWTSWADFGPLGITKASGLRDLTVELRIPPTGTIAIGDGMNDIPMITWANHGVAMGGAAKDVVEAADATTGSVNQDGAAAVIDAVISRL